MTSLRAGLLLACVLTGCATRDAAPVPAGERAPAVFYDATGKRVLVDVAAPDAARPDSPAEAPAPAPGDRFQGESYRTEEEVNRELATRTGERFYMIPGAGGSAPPEKLTAAELGVDPDKPRKAPPPGPMPTADFLACPAPVRVEGLVGGPVRGRQASIDLPIVMADGPRPGYALLFGRRPARLNVWSVIQGAPPVDVVVALLDERNQVVAVVNNFATETIPDSLFRYGKVGGGIDLDQAPWPVAGIAVLGVREAARLLPAGCLPALPPDPVEKGRVMMTWRVAESSKR